MRGSYKGVYLLYAYLNTGRIREIKKRVAIGRIVNRTPHRREAQPPLMMLLTINLFRDLTSIFSLYSFNMHFLYTVYELVSSAYDLRIQHFIRWYLIHK